MTFDIAIIFYFPISQWWKMDKFLTSGIEGIPVATISVIPLVSIKIKMVERRCVRDFKSRAKT